MSSTTKRTECVECEGRGWVYCTYGTTDAPDDVSHWEPVQTCDTCVVWATDDTRVTTWTGGVIMNRVMWGKRHAFSRERHYMRAIDVDGRVWSGVGANGMWCTLRLCK